MRPSIGALGFVIGDDLGSRHCDVVLGILCKCIHLLQQQVENVQPERQSQSVRLRLLGRTRNGLHVEERMEKWVDEACCELHESGQLVLHGCVDIIIFVRCNLKVLFDLHRQVSVSMYVSCVVLTLNKFFSSFSDFSFLSRSLVKELLKRS